MAVIAASKPLLPAFNSRAIESLFDRRLAIIAKRIPSAFKAPPNQIRHRCVMDYVLLIHSRRSIVRRVDAVNNAMRCLIVALSLSQ